MQKRWNISENPDPLIVSDLGRAINVSEPIAKLLVLRGITNFEQAKQIFRPELEQLHDPFLMKGMQPAIDRILLALKNKEAILIYGDYDVDGTTAVSLVYSFFKEYTKDIAYYIPDRYKEGYGISIEGIDFAKANGYSLIIALDCGIKAVEKIEYANSHNIDFII
jgi:single-stranded-DNA-specific exonuclease